MAAKRLELSKLDINQLVHDIHNFGLNYHSREIFLTGHISDEPGLDPGVEYRSASNFIKNLNVLNYLSRAAVTVHMKIDGGCWASCMAMFDAIKASRSPINIIGYAQASSASGILLQAANKRFLTPNTHFMLHHGSMSIEATSTAVASAVEFNERECDKMIQIFAERAIVGPFFQKKGWDVPKIHRYLDKEVRYRHDWYLTAEEAVEMGFADAIYISK